MDRLMAQQQYDMMALFAANSSANPAPTPTPGPTPAPIAAPTPAPMCGKDLVPDSLVDLADAQDIPKVAGAVAPAATNPNAAAAIPENPAKAQEPTRRALRYGRHY